MVSAHSQYNVHGAVYIPIMEHKLNNYLYSY